MTTNPQSELTCVDIIKDGFGIKKNIIQKLADLVSTNKNCSSDNLDLQKIKEAITDNFAKLSTTVNNFQFKNKKIKTNIEKFFIDAAWSARRIDRELDNNDLDYKICITPGTFTDPATRSKNKQRDEYIDISDSFNLSIYNLNCTITLISDFTNNEATITLILKSNDNLFPPFECKINKKGTIVYINTSNQFYNNKIIKNVFYGNAQKRQYINNNINNNNLRNANVNKIAIASLFVVCKEIGDLMQVICMNQIINSNSNPEFTNLNSAILTPDAVLAARASLLGVPYIVSHSKSGLIKYSVQSDSEEINKNYINIYYKNFIDNNKSIIDSLQLFDESNIKKLKVKGNYDKNFSYTPELKVLVDRLKNVIETTEEIFENFNNYIINNIDVKNDENLKYFKIFFESLSVPNIIFRGSSLPGKFANKNINYINSNYKKVFGTFLTKNLENTITLKNGSETLNQFIKNYFGQNLSHLNFFQNNIIHGTISRIIDDTREYDLYSFLLNKCIATRQRGGIKKTKKKQYYKSKKTIKNIKKRKTKKINKNETFGAGLQPNPRQSLSSRRLSLLSRRLSKQSAKQSAKQSTKLKSKLNQLTHSLVETYDHNKLYECYDIFCGIFPYININPYLYYKLISNDALFIQLIVQLLVKNDNIEFENFLYNLIIDLSDSILNNEFNNNAYENEFLYNTQIIKSRFVEINDKYIEKEYIDEETDENYSTITLIDKIYELYDNANSRVIDIT
jgi:hypothetical protein